MTAVVGILNKSAAAIAADSAVTVTGPRGSKIFNRANKIFRISKTQPIGVMIYNQGEFMETPWDTILKIYRSQLDSRIFNRVIDCRDDFLAFLKAKDFFADKLQQKRVLHVYARQLVNELVVQAVNVHRRRVMSGQPDDPRVLANDIEKAIDQQIGMPADPVKAFSEFADFEMQEFDELGYAGIAEILKPIIANGIPLNQASLISKVKEMLFKRLKEAGSDNFFSGVIFTGFGEAEIFPSLIATNISLAINARLRYLDDTEGSVAINHQESSAICPFAQHDVIDTVLAGRDPGLARLYLEQFDAFIRKNNAAIAAQIQHSDPALAARLSSIDTTALTDQLNRIILQETQKRYIDPMMRAITTLSKEDLSEMAESLIYLTYLKRRFTFSEESVGGPVDVAIITKTDGFIWVKRKHYFDIALNQHFLANYQ